ncbi:N-6 DNA methylase [Phaeobacter piscinae]|uniref:N-6 DNA methylase n=1 Tax=Phaeobacter piscinae TaxID=1580596 RepID=UPI0005902C4E|nr:N-6 DNA methylase [Phaeobacter piscinae]UTS79098.1 hypothetical protein OL67_000143 [Phaeobacter piscinae]
MTAPDWREILALSERVAPEFFEQGQPITGTPYAAEIRKAMRTLSITGVFCNQGVPQVMILEQENYHREEVMRVHAALWNQGLASVLVVVSADVVRVFSLSRDPGAGDRSQFEARCLIEAVDAAADALALRDYIYGTESGRLWLEKVDYFDLNARIDRVLLDNLEAAHDLLVAEGLSADEAQAILIQTMFVAYLEDRGITTPDYFRAAIGESYDGLRAVLLSGDLVALETLFRSLQRDFNGDLFVAPCSFDDPHHPRCLTAEALRILCRFREGKEAMATRGGQRRFWGYDFRFIPVELISAVYDRFLGYDARARSDAGAYYTPMFLVDMTVSTVWDELSEDTRTRGVVMDPACGSGIFLVRCFQRLCEHERQASQTGTLSWDSLVEVIARIRGYDLNSGAVRVAVFSLYIALLEEVAPPDIRKLAAKGRLLPSLWNKTLISCDFFDADPATARADIIVGNPPWTSRRNAGGSGGAWSKARGLPTPSGEVAWAFVWKAREHSGENGHVTFLLPAMGFLHNHAASSVAARTRLFDATRVKCVVNLSDLRRQLFDGAIYPTALMMFSTASAEENYDFDYWTPKADLNLRIKRFVSLSSLDKARLRHSDVQTNPMVFKQRLWLRGPEAKLFGHLDRLPKLSDFVEEFGTIQRRNGDFSNGWVIGQGFKPYHPDSSSLSSQQFYDSDVVGRVPDLPVKALTPLALSTKALRPWKEGRVHRRGFERAFTGPRVLYRRGVDTGAGRLRAAYTDVPLSFQHILQAITAPDGEDARAKFITAVLNSRLAVWFAFHGTSSFGASRPEVQQAELLRLPMPEPEDLRDPNAAMALRETIVTLVDREQTHSQEIMRPIDDVESALREIDRLVYAYFDLSDEEIALIDDTVEFILPAVQPSGGSVPELWKRSMPVERSQYAEQLVSSLSFWFAEPVHLSVEIVGSNGDFGILQLRLTDAASVTPYSERTDKSFTEVLGSLSRALGQPIARNFQTVPDIRIFAGDALYLVKPMQRRFWLRSAALSDADAIAGDLQSLLETSVKQGTHT